MRELFERVGAEIERMNERDWRVCEVDEGGKGIQTCEIMEEGGRKGVEVVGLESERDDERDWEWEREKWRNDREERPEKTPGSRELRWFLLKYEDECEFG